MPTVAPSKLEKLGYYVTPWDEFMSQDFEYLQSQHITFIAPTGQGKTTLEIRLIDLRKNIIFLGTKSDDETQDELGPLGFHIAKSMNDVSWDVSTRWVINPGGLRKNEEVEDMKRRQRPLYKAAIAAAYHMGSTCLVVDEGRYICDYLGLKDEVTLAYLQGRSHKTSVVMGTQRPRWVPLEAFDQATHLFFWKDNDTGNIDRIAELSGLRRQQVKQIVPRLEEYQFLYCNTRTDLMVISKVEL